MATTMKWPPTPNGGTIGMVSGPEATTEVVLMVLGDLSANPFNPDDLSMGDITFKPETFARGRIELALRRLRSLISADSVQEESDDDGNMVYTVTFTDRESREQGSVQIHG